MHKTVYLTKEQKRISYSVNELFGHIFFPAAQSTVDLEYVFSFPLTPVPLTLCRRDGTISKTAKNQLFQILENVVDCHDTPNFVGSHIIDGNFLLYCMSPHQPSTYGEISENILISLSFNSKRVDIIFDTYENFYQRF